MTKHWTVLVTATLATLLALFAPAPRARADIFQWEHIDPTGAFQGKQQSSVLAPDGAGVSAAPGADLSYRNLTMAYLPGAKLPGANFTQANLTNASLSGATLTGANLTGAEVRGADFVETTSRGFTAAQLYSTASYQMHDLTGIGLSGNSLSGVNLAGQNLTNASFTLATLTNSNFSHANLTNASFTYATLTGANLTGAEVRGANFVNFGGTGITAAQFYSTASYQAHDLTGIGLYSIDLTGGNFAGFTLTNASFSSATLTGASFNQANLTGASFYGATLTGANLSGAEVRGANFYRNNYGGTGITPAQLYSTASYQAHDLTRITLENNNLAGINLAGQNLTNANFFDANLPGANFTQANLTNATFAGYSYPIYDGDGNYIGEQISLGANLTNANLSGADGRGAAFEYATLTGANTNNLIQSDGHIAGLNLTAGALQVVRDYDGGIPIVVDQHLAIDATGTLRLAFDADPWGSTISFALGVPVARGGTLDLTFAPGVDVAAQSGRTIDLFDWTGVTPTGAFTISSPYTWNLTNLYTTGEVTLAAAPSLPGDFNHDDTVDAADYSVWRDGLGGTYTAADYDVWKAHFGETSGSGSVAAVNATVPEPTAPATLLTGLVLSMFFRRRPGYDQAC